MRDAAESGMAAGAARGRVADSLPGAGDGVELIETEGTLSVACGRQELALAWRALRPAGGAWARLGLLHGYGDHSGRYRDAMVRLAARGVACCALDFRGHGRSGGRRGFCERWEEFVEDLRLFLERVAVGEAGAAEALPLFLLGHSHGGLVLAAAAEEEALPGVAGCILTAPYLRNRFRVPGYKLLAARLVEPVVPWLPIPTGLRAEWLTSDPEMLRESVRDPLVLRGATPRWYLTCLRAQEAVLQRAPEFRLPLLMLVGEADPVADPEAATAFFERAGSADKLLRSYPEGRHELLRERERAAILEEILAWMRPRAAAAAPGERRAMR